MKNKLLYYMYLHKFTWIYITEHHDGRGIVFMTEKELREKNRETVENYFKLHGAARLPLFAEDGVKVIPFNPTPHTVFEWRGKENLKTNCEFNSNDLSTWEFTDMEIFPFLDPNFFMVKTQGHGVHSDGSAYENSYIFTIRLENGLIKELCEYMNPVNGLTASGMEVPEDLLWDEEKMAAMGASVQK